MLRTFRQKIAASVSPIEVADDYAWQKWLKLPDTEKIFIGKIITQKLPDVKPDLLINLPTLTEYGISFTQAVVLSEFKQYYMTARKTNRVFFKLVAREISEPKQFKRLHPDEKKVISIPFTYLPARTKELPLLNKSEIKTLINFSISVPSIKDLLPVFRPKIYEIELLNSGLMPISEDSIEEQIFKFEPLEKFPKVFISHALKSLNHFPAIQSPIRFRFGKQKVTKVILRKISGSDKTYSLDVQEFTTLYPELASATLYPDLDKFIKDLKNSVSGFIFSEKPSVKDETDINESVTKDQLAEQVNESIIEDEKISEDKTPVIDEIQKPEVNELPDQYKEKELPTEESKPSQETKADADVAEKSLEIIDTGLSDFQIKGARFLSNNHRAFLTDQAGLGKTFQAASAIASLFRAEKIKRVLVITPLSEFYSSPTELNSELKGWKNVLSYADAKLKTVCVSGTPEQREKQWNSNADIYLSNYNTFPYDFGQILGNKIKAKKFDCIVLDEFQNIELQGKFYHSLANSNPKYLWCLSSLANEEILEKNAEILELSVKLNKRLSRTKRETAGELPEVIWESIWLNPEEKQLSNYNEVLDIGRDQISLLVESGNPLRFQSNLYTLIHKLNQIANYNADSESSPKSEALLDQLEKLILSDEKVVIFSQYEKAGYKNIVRLLKNRGYKYYIYDAGLPAKELDKILTAFNKVNSAAILLVGGKVARLKVENPKVNYIINFDQWWNPATYWNIPLIVRGNIRAEIPLHIYSFQMLNTLDEKINLMLERRGLNDRNMFSHFPAESLFRLIDIEDWLDALNIKPLNFDETESVNKLNNFTFQELQNKIFRMFERFGYSNLEIEADIKNQTFNITGTIESAGSASEFNVIAFRGKEIGQDEAEYLYESMRKLSSRSKLFIITTGNIEIGHNLRIKNNLSFIDGSRLAGYLRMLNIT